jgi:acetyl esterase/lipase
LPVVVYAHGGGFVSGDLDTDHGDCVELARMAGCLVVSVDYRLAPESRCPAALDDISAAFDFAIANADELNADPSRVALAGRDEGAGLVAGLAQTVFDAEGPRIRL